METVRWALRAYRGSALLLIATAAAGVTAVVSAVMLGRNTLRLAPLQTPDLGLTFSRLSASPAAVQAYALDRLSGILLMLATGAAVVCALTLLSVCVARASARRAERALHRAVGASRSRLVLDGLVEGGVMAVAAATVGIAASLIAIRSALAAWPGTTVVPGAFAAVMVTLVAAAVLVLGVTLPALSAGRMPTPAPPSGVSPTLTVAALQLAISFAVLLAATQIGSHARILVGGDNDGPPGNGQVLQLDTTGSPAERARHLSDLIRQTGLAGVLEVPSVTSITSPGALQGLGTVDVAITDCGRCTLGGIATPQRPVAVAFSVVSPDTFRAMNIRVVEGRPIVASDDWTAPRAVVVNHALASAHFENGRAIGRHIQIGEGPNRWFEVVGVVEDTQPVALGGALEPPYAVYGSVLQLPPTSVDVLVRPPLPAALKHLGTVRRVVSEEQWWAEQAAPLRWFANVLWIGGALVLVLAILGTGAVEVAEQLVSAVDEMDDQSSAANCAGWAREARQAGIAAPVRAATTRTSARRMLAATSGPGIPGTSEASGVEVRSLSTKPKPTLTRATIAARAST